MNVEKLREGIDNIISKYQDHVPFAGEVPEILQAFEQFMKENEIYQIRKYETYTSASPNADRSDTRRWVELKEVKL